MKKIYITRILNFITCVLMLTAIAINKNGKVAVLVLNDKKATSAEAGITASMPAFTEEKSDTITMSSRGIADDVTGFAGATPVEIKLVGGKIAEVEALPNEETKGFFQSVVDAGLLDTWNGLTPQEAIEKQVDAVSGATYSSTAVIKTVNLTLAKNVDNAAASSPLKALLNWKFIITLLALASAIIIPFMFKSKIARTIQLIVNVAVLGLWSHCFLSLSLIINFISNGFDLTTGIIPAILLIVAFIFPLFGKKNHYCNWVCPFGAIQELAGTPLKHKATLPAQAVKWLGYFRQTLWVCILLVMMLGAGFEILDYEAFSAFMFNQASTAILVLAGAFIILSIFVPRPYCRFVCPTGSTMKFVQHDK